MLNNLEFLSAHAAKFGDISDKPHNPMINAGAIVIASLIKNNLRLADRFDYVSGVTYRRRISYF